MDRKYITTETALEGSPQTVEAAQAYVAEEVPASDYPEHPLNGPFPTD